MKEFPRKDRRVVHQGGKRQFKGRRHPRRTEDDRFREAELAALFTPEFSRDICQGLVRLGLERGGR